LPGAGLAVGYSHSRASCAKELHARIRCEPGPFKENPRRKKDSPASWNGHLGSPLSSLMDSLAFGVAIATHNGNLLYTNSYFLEMFGHFNGFLAWLRLRLERSSSSVDLEMLTVSTRLSSAEINWCA
jgi:hypothetical protein